MTAPTTSPVPNATGTTPSQTTPAGDVPVLTVTLAAEARIEGHVDVARWFAAFTAAQREEYLNWSLVRYGHSTWECAHWQRPVRYLECYFIETARAASPLGERPGICYDQSEVGEQERTSIRRGTPGGPAHTDTRWTQADYAALVTAVPWIAGGAR